MTAVDRRIGAMGCTIRLIVDGARGPASAPPPTTSPEGAFAWARSYLEDFDRRLSRFRSDSELARLNSSRCEQVPVSTLLSAMVRAALWAARRSGGLVDPTLGRDLVALGYSGSWPFTARVRPEHALRLAPARRPAAPKQPPSWLEVKVDEGLGVVRRPPGVELDSGGVGKGLAADAVALQLAGLPRVLVDCGGDVAVSGTRLAGAPFEVAVRHPLSGDEAHRFSLAGGGIATSGIDRRLWLREDGTPAHHLVDPATGQPAWTGLISATAIGRTALEAETLAKSALLAGPRAARRLLFPGGGLLVHDSGDVEAVEPAPAIALRRPRAA